MSVTAESLRKRERKKQRKITSSAVLNSIFWWSSRTDSMFPGKQISKFF
jgi:hypothetical protein